MDYTKVLQGLKGAPMLIEYGHPLRPSPAVLNACVFWDIFDDLALFLEVAITSPPTPAMVQGGPTPKPITTKLHKYVFKWIPISGIIQITQDAGVTIDSEPRTLEREEIPPLYTDGKPGWEVLDDGVKYCIESKLFEMGLRDLAPEKPGQSKEKEEAPVAPVVVEAAPMPSTPVPMPPIPPSEPAPAPTAEVTPEPVFPSSTAGSGEGVSLDVEPAAAPEGSAS